MTRFQLKFDMVIGAVLAFAAIAGMALHRAGIVVSSDPLGHGFLCAILLVTGLNVVVVRSRAITALDEEAEAGRLLLAVRTARRR